DFTRLGSSAAPPENLNCWVVVIRPTRDQRVKAVEHRLLDQSPVQDSLPVLLQRLKPWDLAWPRPTRACLLLRDRRLAARDARSLGGDARAIRRQLRCRSGRPKQALGNVEVDSGIERGVGQVHERGGRSVRPAGYD